MCVCVCVHFLKSACSQILRHAVMIKVRYISPQYAEQLLNKHIDCVGVDLTQCRLLSLYRGEKGYCFSVNSLNVNVSRVMVPNPSTTQGLNSSTVLYSITDIAEKITNVQILISDIT